MKWEAQQRARVVGNGVGRAVDGKKEDGQTSGELNLGSDARKREKWDTVIESRIACLYTCVPYTRGFESGSNVYRLWHEPLLLVF